MPTNRASAMVAMEPLDYSPGTAGVVAIATIAEARFVGIDRDEIAGLGFAFGQRTTSKLSISSR